MSSPLSREDLEEILERTRSLWECMRGEKLFITGGTGFFGAWLVQSFLHANERLNLCAQATLLTRNLERYSRLFPATARHPAITLWRGDISNFSYPSGHYQAIIHAATESCGGESLSDPASMRRTTIVGSEHTLDFARQCGAEQFLFVSSGAVYNKYQATQPFKEDDPLVTPTLDTPFSYAYGKCLAEDLCSIYGNQYSIPIRIARCFTFLGPYLPLDAHFAIGNFLGDGLGNKTIRVHSDGSALRSYMYGTDLAVWLWTLLFHGSDGRVYNVGSSEAISIAKLAQTVAARFSLPCEIGKSGVRDQPIDAYVPCTARAQNELGLYLNVSLDEAINRTVAWHRTSEHELTGSFTKGEYS
jgi:nucleoside-diphosphate-sugar epimerase